jgi:hypothetical protein
MPSWMRLCVLKWWWWWGCQVLRSDSHGWETTHLSESVILSLIMAEEWVGWLEQFSLWHAAWTTSKQTEQSNIKNRVENTLDEVGTWRGRRKITTYIINSSNFQRRKLGVIWVSTWRMTLAPSDPFFQNWVLDIEIEYLVHFVDSWFSSIASNWVLNTHISFLVRFLEGLYNVNYGIYYREISLSLSLIYIYSYVRILPKNSI